MEFLESMFTSCPEIDLQKQKNHARNNIPAFILKTQAAVSFFMKLPLKNEI